MRILLAVALVLLIGVLDVSIATRPKVPTSAGVLGKLRRLSRVGNLKGQASTVTRRRRDTSESDADLELKAECIKNGGPEAYSNAQIDINEALENYITVVDSPEFDTKLELANSTGDYAPVVLYLCSKKGDFQKMVSDIADAAKPCFDEEVKMGIQIIRNLTIGFLDVFCQGGGQGLVTFLNTGGYQCSIEKNDELDKCLHPIITDSDEVSDAINETDSDEHDCTKMTTARNCVKREFDTCHNANNTAYMVSFFDWFITPICGHSTDATTAANA